MLECSHQGSLVLPVDTVLLLVRSGAVFSLEICQVHFHKHLVEEKFLDFLTSSQWSGTPTHLQCY